MIIVETNKLSKIYTHDFIDIEHGRLKFNFMRNTIALNKLDLQVHEGESFGLLGPNGAGKSTTIKILMGILFPTSGSAMLMGKPLGNTQVKSKIGFLPENPFFYDYLKGWEFLDFYGRLYGMPKKQRRQKIEELFDLVRLPAHASNLPLKGYSKGMLQRIGLAQALLNNPQLVILDEPQSGLDPLGRKEIRDIILSLKSQGKTVFFSSHILSDAEMICDKVAILNKGELVACGELKELLSNKVRDYEAVVTEISPAGVDKLKKFATNVVFHESEVLLRLNSEEAVRVLLQTVAAGDGRLISLTPRRDSLEEFFIRKVTNRSEKQTTKVKATKK
ncbi:MAG: ABC transporter ATP-binding protein [Candidatus Sumerlaeales bacterium]|nr:ABC transporter ATP-binding protein [Candidatus Sumerlaeales bacterium]